MAHAVYEGLRGFLMKGRSPGGYLHLQLPVDEIDVNVHPAKHEIRFRNVRDAHERINQAVISAMEEYQRNLQATIFHIPTRDRNSQEAERREAVSHHLGDPWTEKVGSGKLFIVPRSSAYADGRTGRHRRSGAAARGR